MHCLLPFLAKVEGEGHEDGSTDPAGQWYPALQKVHDLELVKGLHLSLRRVESRITLQRCHSRGERTFLKHEITKSC